MSLARLISNELIDSHCHLSSEEFDKDREQVIQNAKDAGVNNIVDVAIDLASAKKTLELSKSTNEYVLPTIGIHPEFFIPNPTEDKQAWTKRRAEQELDGIRVEMESNKGSYVMIGECGLDYYWLERSGIEGVELEQLTFLQKYVFNEQIKIASEFNLPLTIHARDATNDALIMLENYAGKVEAVFHSFTGSKEQLYRIHEMGFYVGINGIVTFKGAVDFREMIFDYIKSKSIKTIEDLYEAGIVLETDSPYLAPQNHRGQRNEPAYVMEVFSFLVADSM